MIHDLGRNPSCQGLTYDLCIVGSGPAGVTVARELAGRGRRIAVLESGGLLPTAHGAELKRVMSEGIHIRDESRERAFGGASRTWAGVSTPLDPIDLEARPSLPRTGWPLQLEELSSYYRDAAARYGFPPLTLFGEHGFRRLRVHGQLHPAWRDLDEKIFLAPQELFDFGRVHRALFEGPDVDLWLDATVLRLEAVPGARNIARAIARSSTGRVHAVFAGIFVLAAGGIENARLLLNSRDLCAEGLGNEYDQVGRHLMNHPKNPCGVLRLARPVDSVAYFWGSDYDAYRGYAGIRLKPELQFARGVLHCYVRLEPLLPWHADPGVASLSLLARRVRARLARRRAIDGGPSLGVDSGTAGDGTSRDSTPCEHGARALLASILLHPRSVLVYLYFRVVARRPPRIRCLRLWNFMEMQPHPDNRVLLSNEMDRYGQPLPLVRHRATELDRRSLVALHETLAAEVERLGLGRVESRLDVQAPWPVDRDASHHLGTTRMGTDPRVSVVDPDCKIHDVDNVFVAGGSVFPTSGCANPTFTIVALAIRLARHLEKLAERSATPGERHA